jgi:hypothetical protein
LCLTPSRLNASQTPSIRLNGYDVRAIHCVFHGPPLPFNKGDVDYYIGHA